jgi:hypothetical protein
MLGINVEKQTHHVRGGAQHLSKLPIGTIKTKRIQRGNGVDKSTVRIKTADLIRQTF